MNEIVDSHVLKTTITMISTSIISIQYYDAIYNIIFCSMTSLIVCSVRDGNGSVGHLWVKWVMGHHSWTGHVRTSWVTANASDPLTHDDETTAQLANLLLNRITVTNKLNFPIQLANI